MTLTPPRFHIADDMPMSLGKAIAAAIAPSTEPCKLKAFEAKRLGWVETAPGKWDTIDESDCRQIKKAAQDSEDHWPGEPIDEPAAPPSVQKFRVGDRVRTRVFGDGVVVQVTPATDDECAIFKCEFVEIAAVSHFYADTLELISPASETEGEGWVKWNGGGIPPDCRVMVRFNDGDSNIGFVTEYMDSCWTHEPDPDNYASLRIVAYRVVKP